jgi:DNA polymerase-3 subunit epsilon
MPRKASEKPAKAVKEPKPAKPAKAPKEPKVKPEPRSSKTLVFERAEAILRTNTRGQVGHLDQFKKISKEHSPEDAERWLAEHRTQTLWAREALKLRNALLWDTETTGRDAAAEVIDIGACRMDGTVVLNTLIRPEGKISSGASLVHGIMAADVERAPSWAEVWPSIEAALAETDLIIAYNDAFDRRLIAQACFMAGLPEPNLPPALKPELMIRFANWVGDWDAKWNHYKWHKLESGHRALGDTLAMIKVLEKMASSTVV